MTKSELAAQLASWEGLTERKASAIVDLVFEDFISALAGGDRIEIRGFGSFSIRNRRTFTGINPRTGERIPVRARCRPYFKASKKMIDRINREET